jgi:hypothetical protein
MVATTDRPTMNSIAQWIAWFVLGAANALLVGIGGVIVVVVLLALAVRVARRGDRMSAGSGLLVGFGTTWLAFMGRQAATGGRLDDAGPWLALGIVLVALGVLLGIRGPVRRDRMGLLTR